MSFFSGIGVLVARVKKASPVSDEATGFTKGFLLQALSTLLSRLSGLARDVVTAHFLGASNMSDAFFASFRIPNSIRKLVGEGPLSITFIPIFIQDWVKDKISARRFAGIVFVGIVIFTFFLTVLLFIFMPQFLGLIVPGLKQNQDTFEMAVMMSRVSVPFMILTCSVAVLGGITNSLQLFFPFGITPFILNFCMAISLVVFGTKVFSGGIALSVGVVIGGCCQLIFMWMICRKYCVTPIFNFSKTTSGVRRSVQKFLIRIGPIIFGQGIFQVNMFIDGIFASYSTKTQSYLYYSDRLSQFAITIIGHTLGVVALPAISAYLSQNKKSKALSVQRECVIWAIIWSIPAAVCLFILAHPIVGMIYERGQFVSIDVYHVGNMLRITCLVIPIISVCRILYSSIYALQQVTIPVIVGIVSVLINVSVNLWLMDSIQHYYVSISSAASACFEFLLIAVVLRFKYSFLDLDLKMIKVFFKVVLSSALVGLLCYYIYSYVNSICSVTPSVAIVTFVCIMIYSFLLVVTRILTIGEILSVFSSIFRKRKKV